MEYEFEFAEKILEDLQNLDVTDFDYYHFEEIVEDMTDEEFEDFFKHKLLDILKDISTNYIYFDVDELKNIEKVKILKQVVLKTVFFIMHELPLYIALPKFIDLNIETIPQLTSYLEDNIDEFKKYIIETMDSNISVIKNTVNFIKRDVDNIKRRAAKEMYETRIQFTEKHAESMIKYYEIYQYMIENTPNENLKNYFIKCAENGLLS